MLTNLEKKKFYEEGVIGPFTACPPEHMTKRAQELGNILETQGLHPEPEGFRHLDCRCVYEICTQLPIIKRLSSLIGSNIILWRTHIFTKQPGSLAIPWHQDISNWPIPQGHTVSAWIAIDEATRENACIQFLPGQNKQLVPQNRVDGYDRFGYEADTSEWDTSTVVHMEMQPGQFIIFDELIPHRSLANQSGKSRMGIGMRFTVPGIKIDKSRLFPEFGVLLVYGEDKYRVNDICVPPV